MPTTATKLAQARAEIFRATRLDDSHGAHLAMLTVLNLGGEPALQEVIDKFDRIIGKHDRVGH